MFNALEETCCNSVHLVRC